MGFSRQEYWSGVPLPSLNFPLVIYFTHGDVYDSMLLSPFVPLSPSSPLSTSVFSMSVSPLLPWKQVHQQHLSRSEERRVGKEC